MTREELTRDIEKSNFSQEQYLLDTDTAYQTGYEKGKKDSRRKGHWIAEELQLPDRTILNYHCSVCGRKLVGYSTKTLKEAPFCHCGAEMVSKKGKGELYEGEFGEMESEE